MSAKLNWQAFPDMLVDIVIVLVRVVMFELTKQKFVEQWTEVLAQGSQCSRWRNGIGRITMHLPSIVYVEV